MFIAFSFQTIPSVFRGLTGSRGLDKFNANKLDLDMATEVGLNVALPISQGNAASDVRLAHSLKSSDPGVAARARGIYDRLVKEMNVRQEQTGWTNLLEAKQSGAVWRGY